jgi:hypothetical protein
MNQLATFVQRHGLRIVAAVALAGLSIELAVFNAHGWLAKGLELLAVLALITEALAFVMAVCVEGSDRWYKAVICAAILIGCEAFNAAGSHQAWELSQAPKMQAGREAAQADIDARIGALRDNIATAQQRIDAVPKPVQDTFTSRQETQMAFWLEATAADRAAKERAQAVLDAINPVAETPKAMFDDRIVWGFLAFLGFAKSLGLFAIGMSVAKPSRQAKPVSAKPIVVGGTDVDASAAGRALVARRRDRQAV